MFRNPVDIGNRALQHCGVRQMSLSEGFNEVSKNAREVSSCYDKLRRAELQRTIWRFAIKHAPLRTIDTNSRLLYASLWSSTSIYFIGSIVSDEQNQIWISSLDSNTANEPGNSDYWDLYFGPLAIPLWDDDTSYYAGDVVYKTAGDGTYVVYLSTVTGNEADPATVAAWDATIVYAPGALVSQSAVTYQSLIDFNLNQSPAALVAWTATPTRTSSAPGWQCLDNALLRPIAMPSPIGSGPFSTLQTRNIYRLPSNYLRVAPQDPKAGSVSVLGAPTGLAYTDWLLEGNYLVTSQTRVILFRFVGDVTDVRNFDDLFCEGLGWDIALAVAPSVCQSEAKISEVGGGYQKFMSEARTATAVEQGPVEPPEDDWISCRL